MGALESIQNAIVAVGQDIKRLSNGLDAKQAKLTFDTAPTSGSTNPVTSGGIDTRVKAVALTPGAAGSFQQYTDAPSKTATFVNNATWTTLEKQTTKASFTYVTLSGIGTTLATSPSALLYTTDTTACVAIQSSVPSAVSANALGVTLTAPHTGLMADMTALFHLADGTVGYSTGTLSGNTVTFSSWTHAALTAGTAITFRVTFRRRDAFSGI